jgi:hypothetical protein
MYNFVFFSYFDIEWKVKNILILIRNLIEIKIHDTCTGHNFESILPKDHPCHVCFKLADWFQKRRLLNNFPIGFYVKTMSFLCRISIPSISHSEQIEGGCKPLDFWLNMCKHVRC